MQISNVMWIAAALLLSSAPAAAQCTKDTDCKGVRVCEGGRCVSPAPATPAPETRYSFAPDPVSGPEVSAPAPSLAAPAQAAAAPTVAASVESRPASGQWYRAYGSVAPIILPTGYGTTWGRIGSYWVDGDLELQTAKGIQIAGRFAARRGFHIGGFLSYYTEADYGNLAVGVSMKLGGPVGSRVFMSAVLDFGYYGSVVDGDHPYHGLAINPRFQVDVMTVRAGGFKWALFVAQGLEIVPYASTGWFDYDGDEAKLSFASLRPYLLLGTTFGG